MVCKICNSSNLKLLFKGKVLQRYEVEYFKCSNCGFILTEEPYWLEKAYSSVITSLDIGLISRNNNLVNLLTPIFYKHFGKDVKYLDYGGGYGMFVRLMRDRGLDFYRQDIYCDNIFAKNFDLTDLEDSNQFALVTAFEVFEHLINPIEEIEKMFSYSTSILFSTLLQPNKKLESVEDWWYFVPDTGQHIALYTYESLQVVAKKFDKKLYTNGTSLHLFTDKKLSRNILKRSLSQKVIERLYKGNHGSLLQTDFQMIKNKGNKQ